MHPLQGTSAALRKQFYVRGNIKDFLGLMQTQLEKKPQALKEEEVLKITSLASSFSLT